MGCVGKRSRKLKRFLLYSRGFVLVRVDGRFVKFLVNDAVGEITSRSPLRESVEYPPKGRPPASGCRS